eukprot:sb/3476176/
MSMIDKLTQCRDGKTYPSLGPKRNWTQISTRKGTKIAQNISDLCTAFSLNLTNLIKHNGQPAWNALQSPHARDPATRGLKGKPRAELRSVENNFAVEKTALLDLTIIYLAVFKRMTRIF